MRGPGTLMVACALLVTAALLLTGCDNPLNAKYEVEPTMRETYFASDINGFMPQNANHTFYVIHVCVANKGKNDDFYAHPGDWTLYSVKEAMYMHSSRATAAFEDREVFPDIYVRSGTEQCGKIAFEVPDSIDVDRINFENRDNKYTFYPE